MTAPSPFHVAREASNNFGNSFRRVNDENAIESILSQAMNTGNPEVIQNSIGQILSQVSPERQGVALQYLQNTFGNLQKKQQQEREKAAAEEAGYTFGAPAQVQAQQVKDKAKSGRLAGYGLGGDPASPSNLPTATNGTTPDLSGIGRPLTTEAENTPLPPSVNQSVFKRLSDDQLITLTGAPDREVSEPSKAELKRRDEERNINQKEKESWTKFGQERAKKVLDRAEEIAEALPQKQTALDLMEDSISTKDLSFWTSDNLAEVTGIEAFRSPEGALFKTAAKEYFLGNISRAGARPNQWIEQQIADMLTKIGRSTAANLSVSRALKNELDIEKERVRLTGDIFNELRGENKNIGELGTMVNKRLSKYAEEKQNELFNDLRAIKNIEEGNPQKFHKVQAGTPVTPYIVDALLVNFDNDDVKAMQEAKKLGYSFEE